MFFSPPSLSVCLSIFQTFFVVEVWGLLVPELCEHWRGAGLDQGNWSWIDSLWLTHLSAGHLETNRSFPCPCPIVQAELYWVLNFFSQHSEHNSGHVPHRPMFFRHWKHFSTSRNGTGLAHRRTVCLEIWKCLENWKRSRIRFEDRGEFGRGARAPTLATHGTDFLVTKENAYERIVF